MDSLEIEKILAMKRYKRGTQEQNLLPRVPSFVKYALTTLILLLFVSSPVWVPEILSQLKLFLFASLPNIVSFFVGPKFLFIICNIIVVILISESKLSKASSVRDMYEEKLRKNLSHTRPHPGVTKASLGGDEEREREEEICFGDMEEEGDVVELNKRVDDFIARVKLQRKIEAKIFLCY